MLLRLELLLLGNGGPAAGARGPLVGLGATKRRAGGCSPRTSGGQDSNVTAALLVLGYVLAVPFTVWVPGFKRLWRRRERLVFGAAQTGAVLLAVGYARKHQPIGVVTNGGWALGLTVAYVLEGLKRSRSSAPAR